LILVGGALMLLQIPIAIRHDRRMLTGATPQKED
jgi:hypothetical protein